MLQEDLSQIRQIIREEVRAEVGKVVRKEVREEVQKANNLLKKELKEELIAYMDDKFATKVELETWVQRTQESFEIVLNKISEINVNLSSFNQRMNVHFDIMNDFDKRICKLENKKFVSNF